MRSYRLAWTAAALLLAASACPARAQAGRVCPDPRRPCPGFRAHDLSFVLPGGDTARAEARSNEFFAAILRSGRHCSVSERQRMETQRLFPARKVFSQRFECGGAENNVHYTHVDPSLAVLAVYAGSTRREADTTLAAVARTGRFPGANLRRMQVVYVYP